MIKLSLFAMLLLVACSNKPSVPSIANQRQARFYDFKLTIDFLDPFLGLIKKYSIYSDSLTVLTNAFSKQGKLIKTDSSISFVTKTQLDTIYRYAVELFIIDNENRTYDLIPLPPGGEGNMVRVTLDLNFRGDKYVRDVRKVDTLADNSFSRVYSYLTKTKNSR